ncbi:hypothetical protein A3F66_00325 [candidate division TM6 bacterium RIFCSPHIGHO2_12_FULL_32_22]|nr:MAG: hypothetical protein A3F66_00325 [candidate division TM6 bacterium RIFCSPHIGHO2_12_FULL_32_22]
MEKMAFLLTFLTFFGLFYLLIGLYASRKVKSVSDYFFAGRNLGFLPSTFGLIATQLGGGLLLGTSQKAYEIGIFGILYTLGMSLGFLILGLGIASRLQSLKIDTVAQLFEQKYKSRKLRQLASFLSIVTLCGILVAQIIASKTLLSAVSLNLWGSSSELIFLLFWVFIIAYTIVGGLQAVAIIDSIQVIFIIIAFVLLFIYSLICCPISFKNFVSYQIETVKLTKSFAYYLPIFIVPALFSIIEQDLAQRFFAAKSKLIATYSALAASIFLLLFSMIPIYFGIQAKLLGFTVPESVSPLIVVIDNLTNNITFALIICAIIAAITSTADSLLCAISSNISQDFNLSFTNTSKLTRSKFITLFTGSATLIASYFVTEDIINVLIKSYEISVSCLLVPLLACMYSDKVKKESAFLAIIFGLIGYIIFQIWPIDYNIFYILALSGLGYLVPIL